MKTKNLPSFPEKPSHNFPEVTGVGDATAAKGRREAGEHTTGWSKDKCGKSNSKCRNLGCKDETTRAVAE